jgi:signal transduction histidine kinase
MAAAKHSGSAHEANELAQLQAERERLAEALALAERDRQLLGYEIHDGIIQDLTAAAMLLEGAARQATFATTEASESHATGLRLLRDSIAEARQLIGSLVTVESEAGDLVASLSKLVDRFRTDQTRPVTFTATVESLRLPPSIHHLLLRIAQQALFNAQQHAKASRLDVRLEATGNQLVLTVADDGLGFDPSCVPAGHFGLEGMQARAKILGASLQIDSAPGQGTRINVRMPVPAV